MHSRLGRSHWWWRRRAAIFVGMPAAGRCDARNGRSADKAVSNAGHPGPGAAQGQAAVAIGDDIANHTADHACGSVTGPTRHAGHQRANDRGHGDAQHLGLIYCYSVRHCDSAAILACRSSAACRSLCQWTQMRRRAGALAAADATWKPWKGGRLAVSPRSAWHCASPARRAPLLTPRP